MTEKSKHVRSPTFGTLNREQLLREQAPRGISLGVVAGLLTVAIIAFARAFLFQTFKIPSGSMMPTLQTGDHIIVNKFVFGVTFPGSEERHFRVRLPQVGDVVVFYRFSEFEDRDSNTHYIKRVAALPGDTVEVKNYLTFVNGKPVRQEPPQTTNPGMLLDQEAGRDYGPVKLKDDEYFVLGDNYQNSRDSRFYGPIHLADIEGRADMVYWSWKADNGSTSVRWDRVGLIIH